MGSLRRLSVVVLASMTLAGCAAPGTVQTSYTVNNTKYATLPEALDATQQSFATSVQALPPDANPLHGKARIVIPDQDRLRPLVAQNAKILASLSLDFALGIDQRFIRAEADALSRSKLFDTASIEELNDTVAPEIGKADYLVWYQVRSISPTNMGPWVGAWLIKRAGVDKPAPFAMDPGAPKGTPQYASLVKSAHEAVSHLGGPSVASTSGKSSPDDKDHPLLSTGSGVVVDTKGHILTNDHVLQSCGTVRIRDASETSSVATIEARDAANDLGLLKSAHPSAAAARLRDSAALRQGEEVAVIGYPLGEMLGSGVSVVTGSLTKLVGPGDDSRFLQVSAPVQPGNSGGPLVDDSGNMIGVVSATLDSVRFASVAGFIPQNVNFAIKTTVVRGFLDANHVGYTASTGSARLPTADVVDLARKFTVRIECRR